MGPLPEVWTSDRTMHDALAAGVIELDGPRALVRRLPDWLGRHPVLGSVEAAVPRA